MQKSHWFPCRLQFFHLPNGTNTIQIQTRFLINAFLLLRVRGTILILANRYVTCSFGSSGETFSATIEQPIKLHNTYLFNVFLEAR